MIELNLILFFSAFLVFGFLGIVKHEALHAFVMKFILKGEITSFRVLPKVKNGKLSFGRVGFFIEGEVDKRKFGFFYAMPKLFNLLALISFLFIPFSSNQYFNSLLLAFFLAELVDYVFGAMGSFFGSPDMNGMIKNWRLPVLPTKIVSAVSSVIFVSVFIFKVFFNQ